MFRHRTDESRLRTGPCPPSTKEPGPSETTKPPKKETAAPMAQKATVPKVKASAPMAPEATGTTKPAAKPVPVSSEPASSRQEKFPKPLPAPLPKDGRGETKQAHPGRGSNTNNHGSRRSAPAADGMKRFLVRVRILEIAGSAMPRRARPRNGERRGLVNEREHATPLHLLHPGLRRLNSPIPGEYRETHDQRHKRMPMAPRYPR